MIGYDLNKAYPRKFFNQRRSLGWRIDLVCGGIYNVYQPKSVIDFGCGNGDLLSWFYRRNIPVMGIEGTDNCRESAVIPQILIKTIDLREPILTYVPYDLALCLEVAEHLEPEYAPILVDSICKCSLRVIFTAAIPGQGGNHHVNLQEKKYWITLFSSMGFKQNEQAEIDLKKYWTPKKNVKGVKAYYQNLICFDKKLNTIK